MADFITTAFVQEYKANIELLLQQQGSRLRAAVTEDSYTGKSAKVVEQFGPVAAQKKASRNADTPNMDAPQDARWIFPADYEWGKLVDQTDRLRMIIDPTNAFAQNGANALVRAQDDEIIGAFFGTAKIGEDGTGSETFDTTNYQVGVDVGGTASSLNVKKLREARMRLMAAEVDLDMDPLYIALSAYEHDALLGEIQVTSLDFNDRPVLVDGRIARFLGFNIIHTERLKITSGNRLIPAWVRSGMHIGIWQDMVAKITERSDKSYAYQVYLCQTIGATRLQQGKVIQILCDDRI